MAEQVTGPVQSKEFLNYVRTEDNILFFEDKFSTCTVPEGITSPVSKEFEYDKIKNSGIYPINVSNQLLKYDSDTKLYYIDINHLLKNRDIVSIQVDDGISSIIFNYEIISRDTIRFTFLNKFNAFIYILYTE